MYSLTSVSLNIIKILHKGTFILVKQLVQVHMYTLGSSLIQDFTQRSRRLLTGFVCAICKSLIIYTIQQMIAITHRNRWSVQLSVYLCMILNPPSTTVVQTTTVAYLAKRRVEKCADVHLAPSE